MARNDVYLNINALSPADAVVTGQQDMTAATVPELVLGDTPTFNFLFTDNTNVWPSWAGNASYTLTWALSDAVAGDFAPAATTGNATPITGGWSVILPLNSYDLVGLLNTKRVGQPYPVQNLWQQLRVTDPSGNEITRAMFWTPVRYRAISDTQNTESASPTGGRFVTVNNVNTLTTPTAAQFYAANPVPTSALGTAANGELLIGNGTGFTKSTLTAGTGITVTNGSGSITIDASGAQETLTATVKNAESVAITKGQVVYLFGATGNMPSVKLAYNTSDATSAKTFGVVSDTSIAPNGTGTVTCVGVVDGLNLGAYQDGDTVYLGATPGSFTATKPYAPNHLVYVGIIERANAGNGELYVRVQNGYELDEIHDVQITAPKQSGQTLIYDNTTSLWKNARITAGSNIAVTNGDGSISIGFSGTLPVANGGTGVTTSTGSGSVVLSTSPTLTTPILGTPQSGTLSSCTGLPISTGVSGLGTNVATFLATPSSANLASAVTDETGTGALVFANTPTLVTPNIGAATGTSFNLSGSGTLGTTLTVNGTTDSISKDTGAIVTEGGLGVEKSASIGGSLRVRNALGYATGIHTGTTSDSTQQLLLSSNAAYNHAYISKGSTTLGIGFSSDNGSFVADDSITITAATKLVTLAGNLTVSGTAIGLGGSTVPAWSSHNVLQTSDLASFGSFTGNKNAQVMHNAFWNGSAYKYIETAAASYYAQTAGVHSWFTAASGTAGNTITFAEAARITSGGNVLIGTTTDGGQKLQVAGAIAATTGAANNALVARYNSSNSLFGVTVNSAGQGVVSENTDASTGSDKYSKTGLPAFRLGNTGGSGTVPFWIDVAASGTAGNAITWTNAFQIDNSQNATFAGDVGLSGNEKYLNLFSTYVVGSNSRARLRAVGSGGGSGYGGSFTVDTRTSGNTFITALTIDDAQNATFAGNIKTAAPSGGSAATWRLGTVASVSPTSPNRTIEVEIGGTTYYIHAKTTND